MVAEVEAFFSRSIAPTRRVAIGELTLPSEGGVDAASMLLGAMVAGFGNRLDADDRMELGRLLNDVELGRRTPQPRLRHRLQRDRVGLRRSVHRLLQDHNGRFQTDLNQGHGTPEQQALAAVYATQTLDPLERPMVIEALRRGLRWKGDFGPELLGYLRMGTSARRYGPAAVMSDPRSWAMHTLGLTSVDGRPGDDEIRRAFREAVRGAHPDHGAAVDGAAERIAEIDAARRVLLG